MSEKLTDAIAAATEEVSTRPFTAKVPYEERMTTVYISIRLRNGTEISKMVNIKRNLMQTLYDELTNQTEIREARVFEQMYHHHKTYTEDFSVIGLEQLTETLSRMAPKSEPLCEPKMAFEDTTSLHQIVKDHFGVV